MLNKKRNLSLLAFVVCLVVMTYSVYTLWDQVVVNRYKYLYDGTDNMPIVVALFLEDEIKGFEVVSISKETACVEYKFKSQNLDLYNTYNLKYTNMSAVTLTYQLTAIILVIVWGLFFCFYWLHKAWKVDRIDKPKTVLEGRNCQ